MARSFRDLLADTKASIREIDVQTADHLRREGALLLDVREQDEVDQGMVPGAVEVERTRLESPDYAGTWGAFTPLGRIGMPQDIASAVRFLASPDAAFITGQTVWVDGGLFTQPPWPR